MTTLVELPGRYIVNLDYILYVDMNDPIRIHMKDGKTLTFRLYDSDSRPIPGRRREIKEALGWKL